MPSDAFKPADLPPRALALHDECQNVLAARDLGIISPDEACEVIQKRWGMGPEPVRIKVRDVESPTGMSYPK